MSREELGDAIAEDAPRRTAGTRSLGVPGAPGTTAPDTNRPGQRAEPPKRDRQHRTVHILVAVTLVVAFVAGWLGGRAWGDAQQRETGADDPTAAAVAVDAWPTNGAGYRALVDVVVRVTNLGRRPITLTGAEASFDAGAIESLTPDNVRIGPGATIETVAHTSVACRSPQPLRLYPLQVRRADHIQRSVAVSGAAASLTRVCESLGPGTRILALVAARRDAELLRLTVRSPTGRSTMVSDLHARGVRLEGRPLGGWFDAQDRVIWVVPPRACPPQWQRAGLPRTLTLDVDPGGPATVTLEPGAALVDWLLTGPCAESRR